MAFIWGFSHFGAESESPIATSRKFWAMAKTFLEKKSILKLL